MGKAENQTFMIVRRGRKKNYAQRNKIISTCYSLFNQKDYESITTREIASECNIERALLHHYFSKKEYIAGEILKTITANIRDFLTLHLKISPNDPYLMAYYYNLFLKTTEKRKRLKGLYLVLLRSTNILIKTLDEAIDSKGKILPYSGNQEDELATIITIGCISQLLVHQAIGEIDLTLEEIIKRVIRVHYLYLGTQQEAINEIFETVENGITDIVVTDFVRYFEDNNQWKYISS